MATAQYKGVGYDEVKISENVKYQELTYRGQKVRTDVVYYDPQTKAYYRLRGVTGKAPTEQQLQEQVRTGQLAKDTGFSSAEFEYLNPEIRKAEQREAKGREKPEATASVSGGQIVVQRNIPKQKYVQVSQEGRQTFKVKQGSNLSPVKLESTRQKLQEEEIKKELPKTKFQTDIEKVGFKLNQEGVYERITNGKIELVDPYGNRSVSGYDREALNLESTPTYFFSDLKKARAQIKAEEDLFNLRQQLEREDLQQSVNLMSVPYTPLAVPEEIAVNVRQGLETLPITQTIGFDTEILYNEQGGNLYAKATQKPFNLPQNKGFLPYEQPDEIRLRENAEKAGLYIENIKARREEGNVYLSDTLALPALYGARTAYGIAYGYKSSIVRPDEMAEGLYQFYGNPPKAGYEMAETVATEGFYGAGKIIGTALAYATYGKIGLKVLKLSGPKPGTPISKLVETKPGIFRPPKAVQNLQKGYTNLKIAGNRLRSRLKAGEKLGPALKIEAQQLTKAGRQKLLNQKLTEQKQSTYINVDNVFSEKVKGQILARRVKQNEKIAGYRFDTITKEMRTIFRKEKGYGPELGRDITLTQNYVRLNKTPINERTVRIELKRDISKAPTVKEYNKYGEPTGREYLDLSRAPPEPLKKVTPPSILKDYAKARIGGAKITELYRSIAREQYYNYLKNRGYVLQEQLRPGGGRVNTPRPKPKKELQLTLEGTKFLEGYFNKVDIPLVKGGKFNPDFKGFKKIVTPEFKKVGDYQKIAGKKGGSNIEIKEVFDFKIEPARWPSELITDYSKGLKPTKPSIQTKLTDFKPAKYTGALKYRPPKVRPALTAGGLPVLIYDIRAVGKGIKRAGQFIENVAIKEAKAVGKLAKKEYELTGKGLRAINPKGAYYVYPVIGVEEKGENKRELIGLPRVRIKEREEPETRRRLYPYYKPNIKPVIEPTIRPREESTRRRKIVTANITIPRTDSPPISDTGGGSSGTTPPQPPPTEKTGAFIFPKDSENLKPVVKQVQGYNVYAKEKGKFIKLNKQPLPENTARNLGAEVVDNTASAQFRLKKVSKVKEIDQQTFIKSQKFKRVENTYLERNTYRIDSVGELQGITVKGYLANKNKTRF